ncbi:PREDICTED: mitochondrial inner membrane protease subunit 1 [Nicrophorus vespilloides]|uniref:Mitochondrial inner membrane protease subunit n=1 Tax=Nicrophorus vespilloides TaxID=110193 RepID=A0ABM1MVI0_NICVS|nr:PREDICTED: mitochondrial inner membrane protease subunit 1 [Nicrophorus vespilloides]
MNRVFSKLMSTLGYTVQYYCIAHCTFQYVANIVVCTGPSMEPTIYTDDILITERLTLNYRNLQRGDIIIARCPSSPRDQICKRITGLPGDRMITELGRSSIVPRGHVWIEGDNRSNSSDSRSYGPIPQGLIKSRAVCKVWPPQEICSFTE